jgi:hypothetical protein
MTVEEMVSRDNRMIDNIQAVLSVHQQLRQYAAAVQVSIENTAIVLRGHLPSVALKQALIPAIRQAGVLAKVCNEVQVEAG